MHLCFATLRGTHGHDPTSLCEPRRLTSLGQTDIAGTFSALHPENPIRGYS